MYNKNIPSDRELPSTAKLIKSTIIAVISALLLLLTVVMPAEFGIDPTGVGEVIGLKKMGEIKMSLAKDAAEEQTKMGKLKESEVRLVEESASAPESVTEKVNETQGRSDEMSVTLAPNEGTEIKVAMQKGKIVNYSWETDGGKANFDVHADSKELKIDYHGYEKGSAQKKEGVIEAAFNGEHGWFWRNRTSSTITITLKTSGEYTEIKHMK